MLNKKRLGINIILVVFVLILSGCAGHKIKGLPTDLASKLEKELENETKKGFNFGYVFIIDANTGKGMFLKRDEKLEDGSPRYEISQLTGPITVKKVHNISSYSVIGANVDDERYSSCNIITINGNSELICKKTDTKNTEKPSMTGDFTSHLENTSKLVVDLIQNANELNELPHEIRERIQETMGKMSLKIPELRTLSKELVNKFEKLGEGTVNDIGFIIVHDMQGKEIKILKSEGYEAADISLLNYVNRLNRISTSDIISFENSCCVTKIIDGDEVIVCDRLGNC